MKTIGRSAYWQLHALRLEYGPSVMMRAWNCRSSTARAPYLVLAFVVAACGSSNGKSNDGGAGAPGIAGASGGNGPATGGTGLAGGGGSATAGASAGGSSTSGGASGAAGAAGAGGAAGHSGNAGGRGGAAGAHTSGTGGGAGAAGQAGSTADGGVSASQATIVPDPSWACGMTKGIVAPARGTLVFSATLQVTATQDVGTTQYGHRQILDVGGGTVTGSRLQATVLKGGFDFELTLSNGVIELEQIDVLKASDGTLIYLRTCGVAPAGASEVRIVPAFEVANSSALAWLNTGTFVGTRTVDETSGTMELDVYDVSSVTGGGSSISIAVPAGATPQPWDCSTATGAKGASVFTENVTLGSSLSIGASTHGTRNIIPITGGMVTGQVSGSVLYGGGDYQLVGSPTKLDARYVISSGGDYVIVRNCGPLGSLVPLFETRADGPFASLNKNTFVSSDPGSGSGGVSITFYQRQ
jgi:hypothetical protein